MTIEEATPPPTDVWPDNVCAVNVFVSMSTQWRVGANGPTGLDYGALPQVMRMIGVAAKDRLEAFDAVRTMESVALEIMRKAKK